MYMRGVKISNILMAILLLVTFLVFFPNSYSSAESKKILEEIEDEESGDASEDNGEAGESSSSEYEFNGFLEIENTINTYKKQEPGDANKKNELRNNLKYGFTGEIISLKAIMNMYVNSNIINQFDEDDEKEKPISEITVKDLEDKKKDKYLNGDYVYADEFTMSRNLRFSDRGYEISFNELYLGFGTDLMRMRLGNQIYGWGTADTINPTSYFNPQDGRELLFKDEDEIKMAIPSVSLLIFMGDGSLELVYAPIHVPQAQAPRGNFWATSYEQPPFPVITSEPDELPFEPFNYAYGGRFSFSFWGIDMSFSGYHGPDPEPITRPLSLILDTNTVPNQPVGLLIKSEYHIANYYGVDFSTTLDKFVFQFEAAYSPDRIGVALPNGMTFEELREISDPAELEINLPFFLTRSQYISYSAGANYFVPINRIIEGHEGESVLLVEWHDARYFDYISTERRFQTKRGILQPQMSHILITGFKDSYFSGWLNLTLAAIFDMEYKSQMFMPQLGLDFQNGFTINFTYGRFRDPKRKTDEMPGSLFGFFVDKDVAIMKMRYEF